MAERTPPQRQPSTPSRHSSLRHSNPDIFSDEFALDSIPVADGFQPSSSRDDATTPARAPSRTPSRTFSRRSVAFQPSLDQSAKPVKRKQVPQGYAKGGSISSQNDGPMSQIPQRTPSTVSAMSDATSYGQRPSSILSGYSMPRAQSIYRGATGPSHPYGMYPQDTTLNRTSTISTIRPPDRSYSGANGPTHPYGMYPQNIGPEGEGGAGSSVAAVAPVGFPGLGQHYTRRLGPDGEEADDIIGPDGHTEQLPPYTRYPHAAIAKERYAPDAPDSQDSVHSPLQMAPTLGSLEEIEPSDDDHAHINAASEGTAGLVSERATTKERWASRGRKRTCCGAVPRWALALIVVLSLLLVSVLGGVIGRVVSLKNKKGQDSNPYTSPAAEVYPSAVSSGPSTVTVTVMPPDATPIASPPSGLPMLPKGDFGIPLGSPTDSSSSCIAIVSPDPPWQCVTGAFIGLNVTPADYGATEVSIYTNMPSEVPYFYGAQAPVLKSLSSLQLVTDNDDPSNGPAYFFQQTYDKLVILPEGALSLSTSKRSLSASIYGAGVETRELLKEHRAPAIPGAKPWFCFWNGTVLEGFIYVTQNITDPSQNTTAIVNSMLQSSTAVATQTLSQASAPSATSSNPSASSGGYRIKRDVSWPSGVPMTYPKVVKIEERRDTINAVQPYCEQMQILYNHALGAVPNPNGNGNSIIQFEETEQSLRRRDTVSSCGCEWLSS